MVVVRWGNATQVTPLGGDTEVLGHAPTVLWHMWQMMPVKEYRDYAPSGHGLASGPRVEIATPGALFREARRCISAQLLPFA